jgi:antitoxin (DNA-binding transcriptional repressor) of toxin-antitoxin stability system
MKFVAVRELRTSPAKVWKDLKAEKELVVTNNGKPFALLTPLSEANFENELKSVRKARALSALHQIQMESVRNGTDNMSMEEIDAVIAEVRAEAKAKKASPARRPVRP